MDFDLDEEQRAIVSTVKEFCERTVKPRAPELDRTGRFPSDTLAEMGKLGLLGPQVPLEFGGTELPAVTYACILEEIARACAATAVTYAVHTGVATYPLVEFGTPEQKREWLPRLASGETLGAFALSEPGVGSDPGGMEARAVRRGDEYVLSGTKAWITNGAYAGLFVVMAKTQPERRARGITAFLLSPRDAGVSMAKAEHKMGIRGSVTNVMNLDDVRIPAGRRLGEEGEGMRIALSALDASRVGIAAQGLGIARACLEESLAYAKERVAFGKPIGSFQAIQWKIADMATELEAARLLTLRAASLKDGGVRCTKEAAMAKLLASELAMKAAVQAVQIFGGNGYVTEFPVERYFRDAKVTTIYEGTSEIQRLVIARQLGLPTE
ncbi:MAG TPA: acyl-CoA dehydrogenase family protein [Candidatus Thermoplasmatota archaeon]|nr:acyl-CoA dehydrogenase family protein [Candidatus Thermoplasmatota archaeon]